MHHQGTRRLLALFEVDHERLKLMLVGTTKKLCLDHHTLQICYLLGKALFL